MSKERRLRIKSKLSKLKVLVSVKECEIWGLRVIEALCFSLFGCEIISYYFQKNLGVKVSLCWVVVVDGKMCRVRNLSLGYQNVSFPYR